MADVNELAVVGYWFYGGADAAETAALYCSWGLIEDAPEEALAQSISQWLWDFFP
jgi:hypothetical protein